MVDVIRDKQDELVALCRRFHVRRLEVFGSAAVGQIRESSDLDFLVEFDDQAGPNRFDHYFALSESLKALFDRPIDLIEPGGLRNPYFIRRVNETRRCIYAAS